MRTDRATLGLDRAQVPYRLIEFGSAATLEEAARRQGVEPRTLIKSMVVRRDQGDLLFVLVTGDRVIDWPKLRAHLGRSRLSFASADEIAHATGYRPGSITPLGSTQALPTVADARVERSGQVSIGTGIPGRSVRLAGADLVAFLGASTADVTRPLE